MAINEKIESKLNYRTILKQAFQKIFDEAKDNKERVFKEFNLEEIFVMIEKKLK